MYVDIFTEDTEDYFREKEKEYLKVFLEYLKERLEEPSYISYMVLSMNDFRNVKEIIEELSEENSVNNFLEFTEEVFVKNLCAEGNTMEKIFLFYNIIKTENISFEEIFKLKRV